MLLLLILYVNLNATQVLCPDKKNPAQLKLLMAVLEELNGFASIEKHLTGHQQFKQVRGKKGWLTICYMLQVPALTASSLHLSLCMALAIAALARA